MEDYKQIFIYVLGFVWILFASDYFAKYIRKTSLPLITGFLLAGIFCGPHVLNLIEEEAISNLGFVNDISLAFIAFAAGAELYLKEIRTRARSIAWNIFGQLIVTFFIGTLGVYLLAEYIPFMKEMTVAAKLSVSLLAASIFVARSPSSAIAVISEMRAKGPFTQTIMGVTVIKDVLVIGLFAVCLSFAMTFVSGTEFKISKILLVVVEIVLAIGLGYILGKLISLVLSFNMRTVLKTILILGLGYSVFLLSHYVQEWSPVYLGIDLHLEPLLISIIASFFVTNYSKFRPEFRKVLDDTGPVVYVAFFTLVGAMLSIHILAKVWSIALLLFLVRLIAVIIGAYFGTSLAHDPRIFKRISWMAYVTQAGVGLGLATEVASEFNDWGAEFSTLIIAVIVLNQIAGPPLFKWAINLAGEAHTRGESSITESARDAIIFGLEDQSLALARQLKKHGWGVKIICLKKKKKVPEISDIKIEFIKELDLKSLQEIEAEKAETIVLMLSDKENLGICELIYERIGTKEIVVRLNDREFFNRFHEMGALVMDPGTVMVGLLDHFVRAPTAASLLLGMDDKQDSEDFEVLDKQLHGIAIRDLSLPGDILILSVKRKGQVLVTHGYTRLRKKDVVTAVGSVESLEKLRLIFGK